LSEASLGFFTGTNDKCSSGDKKAFCLLFGFGKSESPKAFSYEKMCCFLAEIDSDHGATLLESAPLNKK